MTQGLTKTVDFIKPHIPSETIFITDLPGVPHQNPLHIGTTNLWWDIVIWQDNPKEVTLLELTVWFETSFKAPTWGQTIDSLAKRP